MTKTKGDFDIDMLALLEKAAESMDDPDTATTDELLSEFFQGLEFVIGENISAHGTGPLTKARLVGMHGVLDVVNKMSEADLAQWIGISTPASKDRKFNDSKSQAFEAKSNASSEDPHKNYAASQTPAKDLGNVWNPTGSGAMPGASTGKELRQEPGFAGAQPSSSRPFPGMAKSLGAFLDSMADATPAEIERARTGLSQLDPAIVETLDKAVGSGQLIQSLDGEIDEETEALLRRGALLDERELRKGIIVNSAHLLERVAKLRDAALEKQTDLVDDSDDAWEMRAREGRGG